MENQLCIYKISHTKFVQILQQLARTYAYVRIGWQKEEGFKNG